MLVLPTDALVYALGAIRDSIMTDGNTLRLMKNDAPLGLGTNVDDLVEADFSGYSPLPLTQWGAAMPDTNNNATMSEVAHTFTQTSPAVSNVVYGYFVTLDVTGELLWAEKGAPGGFAMDGAGKTYSVTPTLVLRDITT